MAIKSWKQNLNNMKNISDREREIIKSVGESYQEAHRKASKSILSDMDNIGNFEIEYLLTKSDGDFDIAMRQILSDGLECLRNAITSWGKSELDATLDMVNILSPEDFNLRCECIHYIMNGPQENTPNISKLMNDNK